MGRNCKNTVGSSTLALGIRGDRHSLCGAIKRFELLGKQLNNPLSLKEQCARHIALIKYEQMKWFITTCLPPHLFTYVTEDIFDLQNEKFKSNYPEPFYMCQECMMDTYEKPLDNCRCPNMYDAIKVLNKYLKKRLNIEDDDNDADGEKQFEFIYKIPNDWMDHSDEAKDPASFFLYLSPTEYETYYEDDDYCNGPYENYKLLTSKISVEMKFLFVDVMRFFGGFISHCHEPQLIFYRRREYVL